MSDLIRGTGGAGRRAASNRLIDVAVVRAIDDYPAMMYGSGLKFAFRSALGVDTSIALDRRHRDLLCRNGYRNSLSAKFTGLSVVSEVMVGADCIYSAWHQDWRSMNVVEMLEKGAICGGLEPAFLLGTLFKVLRGHIQLIKRLKDVKKFEKARERG